MREIPAGLAANLEGTLSSLCFCWKVVRSDGVAIGFTSHDGALGLDGFDYRATPGMEPSAISVSDAPDGGDMAVRGALSSSAIRAEDIATGRFDDARVELRLADWRAPAAGSVLLASGRIGDIRHADAVFEAELRTAAAELSAVPVELCSPECRARFGDPRCRVDLAPLTRTVTLVAVLGERSIEVSESTAAGIYAYGRLRPLSGSRTGLDYEIIGSDGTRVDLRDSVAASLQPGDLIALREGCDRRFSTCRDRFGNVANFRGEPHVPGADSVLRYPSL